MCLSCVQAGASMIPAALAVVGGMAWKHGRDERRHATQRNDEPEPVGRGGDTIEAD